jgi:histone deacetylase 6
MRAGIVNVPEIQSSGAVRLHDVIRSAQREVLRETHNMLPLFIQRKEVSRSFENQVLVTPFLEQSRRILVIIHDP